MVIDRRRLGVLAGAALLLGLFAWMALASYHNSGGPHLKDGSPVVEAVSAFCQDRVNRGLALPAAVTLGQLVEARYLSEEAAAPFGGLKVEILLSSHEGQSPSVITRAQMSDGTWVAVLADGSAHLLHPQQRFP